MIGQTTVIGFGYKARHGKDTACRLIHEAFPEETKVYHFADALKAYCRVAFGMREKDARLLQVVGTDVFRRSNPNIWIDVLRAQIEEEQPAVALIGDVRFPNEVAFCDVAAEVSRVTWGGQRWPDDTSRDAGHVSETALASFPWATRFVNRDGAVEEFAEALLGWYASLRSERRS